MEDKLKIKIWNYKNIVLYEVLEQDEYLRYEANIFEASNGWQIHSGSYPEINTDEKIIYIRGDEKEFDEIVCTIDINSVGNRKLEYAEHLVKEIEEAVKEFNESVYSKLCCEDRLKEMGTINDYIGGVGLVCDDNIEKYIHTLFSQQNDIIVRLNEIIKRLLKEKSGDE